MRTQHHYRSLHRRHFLRAAVSMACVACARKAYYSPTLYKLCQGITEQCCTLLPYAGIGHQTDLAIKQSQVFGPSKGTFQMQLPWWQDHVLDQMRLLDCLESCPQAGTGSLQMCWLWDWLPPTFLQESQYSKSPLATWSTDCMQNLSLVKNFGSWKVAQIWAAELLKEHKRIITRALALQKCLWWKMEA